jgi:hypothetical protein
VTKSKIADNPKISALNDTRPFGEVSDKFSENCSSAKITADSKRLMNITVVKGSLGLGFCIQGGVGSPAGDRPISIKRLFRSKFALIVERRHHTNLSTVRVYHVIIIQGSKQCYFRTI